MKKNNRSEWGEESVSAGDVFAQNIVQILEEYEHGKQQELSMRDEKMRKLHKKGKKKGKENQK